MNFVNARFADTQGRLKDPIASARELMGPAPKTNTSELLPDGSYVEFDSVHSNPAWTPPKDAVIKRERIDV